MSFQNVINYFLVLGLIYLAVGVIFAMIVIIKGISSLDPAAKGSGWGFKLIIFPGMVAFWPIMWRKWRNKQSP